MPVTRIKPKSEDHPELVKDLVRVLHENQPKGPPDDPQIIIKEIRHTNSIHVTVIWDRWADIDAEERGRLILDAIAKELGEAEMLRVSMALGVTKAEADRLGLGTKH
ncbi:MAG: hypothetical protein QUV05_10170 [Phycisphaerae bacterium]|jgi:hypothetical protein|nr:hypothetical protein [Phycisphaerae bacterium]